MPGYCYLTPLAQIDRTHRVGKPRATQGGTNLGTNRRPRDIVVIFTSYRARQSVYRLRSQLKEARYKMFFINEELTKQRGYLFYQARCLVKNKSVASVWTIDGVIHTESKVRLTVITSGPKKDWSKFAAFSVHHTSMPKNG